MGAGRGSPEGVAEERVRSGVRCGGEGWVVVGGGGVNPREWQKSEALPENLG